MVPSVVPHKLKNCLIDKKVSHYWRGHLPSCLVGSVPAQIGKSDGLKDLHLVEDWTPVPTSSSYFLFPSRLECATARLDLKQVKY